MFEIWIRTTSHPAGEPWQWYVLGSTSMDDCLADIAGMDPALRADVVELRIITCADDRPGTVR